MSTVLDASIGFGLESTYGTGVTPVRWVEHSDEDLDFQPERKQGAGFRVGTKVPRASRRVTPVVSGGGSVSFEPLSKGMGLLWKMLLGEGTSTLVSTGVYQQVFTLADTLQSFTMQKGVPRIMADASATIDPITFLGCVAPSFSLDGKNGDIVTAKASIDAREVVTSTPLTAPTYTTGANLFHFAGATIFSGVLTAPTTTALAVGATPLGNVVDWSVAVDHQVDDKRYLMGGGGKKAKPVARGRKITGKMSIEYSDTVFRDAFLADSSMALVVTYQAGALTAGFETLQIVIPDIRLDGELPKGGGDVTKMSCSYVGLDNLTAAQPIWIVTRTADAAL